MVFWKEVKKFWRPWIFVVCAVLCMLFWVIWLEFDVRYFPNGEENKKMFQLQADWVKKYGPTLEDNEIEEIRDDLEALCKKAEAAFVNEPLFRKNHITTYQEFEEFCDEAWDDDKKDEDATAMKNYLESDAADRVYEDIYGIKESMRFVEEFQSDQKEGKNYYQYMLEEDSKYTQKEYDNVMKVIAAREGWRNILEYQIPQATTNYWGGLMALGILSVMLLTAPVLVRDRMLKMHSLQWSSKKGRPVINTQFGAALFSAFCLATIYLVLFGGIFATNKTWLFWNCRMYSFDAIALCWGNWTYGTYCLILIGIYYLVCLGSCALVFVLSRFSSHYISLLLKTIPVYVILYLMCSDYAFEAFYYGNSLYQKTRVPYIEAIVPACYFIVGAGLAAIVCWRQRRAEIE